MAKVKFDDLSAELKSSILDKLLRPSDLKNICLVNKQLHELAVKILYRNVALDLGSPNDKRLAAFLNPKNIGLQYMRQIRLYLANVRDRCGLEQQAHLVSRMILEFLPEDILEEFSWCPWSAFSADNLLLLYKKQRKMKWLEVMDLDRDILPELKKSEKSGTDVFQHTRKLALYPENRDTLRLCEFFIQKTKDRLEEMIIHANFNDVLGDPDRHGDTIEARELNDSATAPGLVTSTMFSHMLPFEKCEPFKNLRSLRLHRISLRHCADTWCKFVNFNQIDALRIYQCPGTKDNLLLPGRGKDMGDGWETKRSRGEHIDWVIVKLGTAGTIDHLVVDTAHFRGNFPQKVQVFAAAAADRAPKHDDKNDWVEILSPQKTGPDQEHKYGGNLVKDVDRPYGFLKLVIIPDGGVKRLRCFGRRSAGRT